MDKEKEATSCTVDFLKTVLKKDNFNCRGVDLKDQHESRLFRFPMECQRKINNAGYCKKYGCKFNIFHQRSFVENIYKTHPDFRSLQDDFFVKEMDNYYILIINTN